jgi:D-glycero-beta-D-manno-heptose 1-phosphate adenylyltransferase
MKSTQQIQHKIYTLDHLLKQVNAWRVLNKKIVFTNAIFDILKKRDITILNEAASYGDILIVGINADESIKRLKDLTPAINNENERALLLASLLQTDAVLIFEEDSPLELIKLILPNVLVNIGENSADHILAAKEILAAGGKVEIMNIM